eukprot:3932380-Rhodomonas_salina.2
MGGPSRRSNGKIADEKAALRIQGGTLSCIGADVEGKSSLGEERSRDEQGRANAIARRAIARACETVCVQCIETGIPEGGGEGQGVAIDTFRG